MEASLELVTVEYFMKASMEASSASKRRGVVASSMQLPSTSTKTYVCGSRALGVDLYLCLDGADGVTLSDESQQLGVNLVRTSGPSALTGHYLVKMTPQPDIFRHLNCRLYSIIHQTT